MRLLAVLLCALTLFPLCSCSILPGEEARGKAILEGFTQTYQTDITLTAEKLTLRAHLSRSAPDTCRMSLSEPESLAGYSYLFREDGIDVSYKDLTFRLGPESAGCSAPLVEAACALSAMLLPEPGRLPKQKDGHWELTGNAGDTPCVLWIDGATGTPMKLLLHDGKTEIGLENFSFSG